MSSTVERWRSRGLAFGWLVLAFAASGAPKPGPEFQINTYTPGSQRRPTVTARAAGGFVVVWVGGSGGALAGRLLDAGGGFLGTEFCH